MSLEKEGACQRWVPPRYRSILYGLIACAAAGAVLWLGARAYLPFIADDALISLRYSERLLGGQGLTWTDGERVEGYSNLLWVLLCAGIAVFRVSLVDAARLLGLVSMLMVLPAIALACAPLNLKRSAAVFGAMVLFASAGPVHVWAFGGLEQPLLVALLTWGIGLAMAALDDARVSSSRLWLAGVCLALACWTRPDAPLFIAGVCVVFVVLRRWREALRLAAPGVAAVLLQLAFRRVYYDEWVPNTARVKLALTAHRLAEGGEYIWGGARGLAPFTVLIALAAVAGLLFGDGALRRKTCAVLVPMLGWCGYVATIGGDIFPARRHWVPVLALGALLVAVVVAGLSSRRIAGWVALGPAYVAALVLWALEGGDAENQRAHAERWEWDGAVIGTLLREAFGAQQPLLAADPAGCVPFFSKLPSLDMMGLNDRYIATHPPATMGEGGLGHEMGDGNYVLSRKPDLVMFCADGREQPCFLSGRQMVEAPSFKDEYRLITFEGRVPYAYRSRLWVRWYGGRIGLRQTPERVEVPAFLFANTGESAAVWVEGRLVAALPPHSESRIYLPHLEPGRWELQARAHGLMAVSVERGGTPVVGRVVEGDSPVTVSLRTSDAPVEINEVVFVREAPVGEPQLTRRTGDPQ